MKHWMKLLGSIALGLLFARHEAHEIEKHLDPHDPAPGIWSAPQHELVLEHDHVEIRWATLPLPEPPINNWRYYDGALARRNADQAARARIANADFALMSARGVVLRSPDHVAGPASSQPPTIE